MSNPPLMYPGKYADRIPKNRWEFNNPNASFKSKFLRWLFKTIFRKKDDNYLRYECLGVHVMFQDLDWYVPQGKYEPYLYHIIKRYVDVVPGKDPFERISDYHLVYTKHGPMGGLYGHTWPSKRMSHVHSIFIFGGDVDGWEVSLQLQHLVFGGHDEDWDENKMIEIGVYNKLADYPGSQEQIAWRREKYGA